MHKAILLFPLALAARGGSPSNSGPAMVSLRAAGVNPSAISLMSGSKLQFTNDDAVDHQVASNDCSELSSPILAAGGMKTFVHDNDRRSSC